MNQPHPPPDESETRISSRFVTFMALMFLGAFLGQALSMWSLVGFHDEKVQWEVEAKSRDRVRDEVKGLNKEATTARALAMSAADEMNVAQAALSQVRAQLDATRVEEAVAQDSRAQASAETMDLKAQIGLMQIKIDEERKRSQDLKQDSEKFEARNTELSDINTGLQSTNESRREELRLVEERLTEADPELKRTMVKLRNANRNVADIQQELAEGRDTIKKADQVQDSATEKRKQLSQLTTEIGQRETRTNELEELEKIAVITRDDLNGVIASLRADKDRLSPEVARLETEEQGYRTRIAALQKEVARRTDLISDIDAKEESRKSLEVQVDALGEEKRGLTVDLDDLRRTLSERLQVNFKLEADQTSLRSIVQELAGQRKSLQSDLVTLQANRDSLEEEVASLREDATAQAKSLVKFRERSEDLQSRSNDLEKGIYAEIRKLAEAVSEAVREVQSLSPAPPKEGN